MCAQKGPLVQKLLYNGIAVQKTAEHNSDRPLFQQPWFQKLFFSK